METQATTIYFPKNLHREIKKISEKEERSFNKQVITLLKKALEGQESLTGKGN